MQRLNMFLGFFFLLNNALQASSYQANMDQSQWSVSNHILSCQMSQEIPSFGHAFFNQPAGEPLQFYLTSHQHVMSEGKASLRSLAPIWNPNRQALDLGLIEVQLGPRPIQIEADLAVALLHELHAGRSPQFLRRAVGTVIDGQTNAVEVSLSAVNFRDAYTRYQQCLGQLMPVSLVQLSRSKLNFLPNQSSLNEEAISWLATLVDFIKRDGQLESVFIDGYTDNSHSARYNRALSKDRAEAVQDYFLQQGVAADLILLRFHGERFPIASNEDAEGRQKNRRVTIRLQRQSLTLAHR